MLKLAVLMNNDTRIKCMLESWVAIDENCGTLVPGSSPIRLRRSNGRRKTGRPTKYYLQGTGAINTPVIEAYNDYDAVTMANELLDS